MAKIVIMGKVEKVRVLGEGDEGQRYLLDVRDGERFSVFITDKVLDSLGAVLPEVGLYAQVSGEFSVNRNGRYLNLTINGVREMRLFALTEMGIV